MTPVASHWAAKLGWDFLTMTRVATRISGMDTRLSSVRPPEMVSIMTMTPTSMKTEKSIWPRTCCSDEVMLSTSLTVVDMIWPRGTRSK